MKLYKVNYMQGVEGLCKTATKNYIADSQYQAEQKFKAEFAGKLNSNNIDKVSMVNIVENDLPVLNDDEMKRAGEMFLNSTNPVLEYQLMKAGV